MTNPFIAGISGLIPDKTIRHLIGIDTRAMRSNMLLANNRQEEILTFISRELVEAKIGLPSSSKGRDKDLRTMASPPSAGSTQSGNEDGIFKDQETAAKRFGCIIRDTSKADADCLWARLPFNKTSFNPDEIKRRLGHLALVGQQVQYLNRVRVIARDIDQAGADIVVTNPKQIDLQQGDRDKTIELQGSGLHNISASVPRWDDVVVSVVATALDGTSAKIKFTKVGDAAQLSAGTARLIITGSGKSWDIPIYIQPAKPIPDKPTEVKKVKQGSNTSVELTGKLLLAVKSCECDQKDVGCELEGSPASDKVKIKLHADNKAKPGPLKIFLSGDKLVKSDAIDNFAVETAKPEYAEVPEIKVVKSVSTKATIELKEGKFLTYVTLTPSDAKIKADTGTCDDKSCKFTLDCKNADPGSYTLAVKNGTEPASSLIKVTIAP